MPATASRRREFEAAGSGGAVTRDLRSRLAGWLLIAGLAALVAHGCHSGDHDFEPAVAHPAAE